MEREVVDSIVAMTEHRRLPVWKGRHGGEGRAAGDELERGIKEADGLGGFAGQPAIFLRGLLPHLPRAVHLVAEAPELNAMGLRYSMAFPKVRPVASARVVAVLDQISRRVEPARAEVHGHHRLGSGLLGPGHELIESEEVRLDRPPGEVQAPGPRLHGADGVLPVEGAYEVPARVANYGNVQLANEGQDIAPKAPVVGLRVVRLIDAAISARPRCSIKEP